MILFIMSVPGWKNIRMENGKMEEIALLIDDTN